MPTKRPQLNKEQKEKSIKKSTEWRKRNPERYKAYLKSYGDKYKEKRKIITQKWREENKEHIKKYGVEYRVKNPYLSMEYRLKKNFNISREKYNILFEKQKGLCAICKRESKKRLAVDHCHKKNKVRGLLCFSCNIGLGYFKDNPKLLTEAIIYLKNNV